MVESHLLFATNIAMRGAYNEAADLIRAGDVAGGLAKVPTIARVNQVMAGRRQVAFLETHHTATKEWTRRLIPGITDAELDAMPALALDKAWHRQFNDSGVPRDYVFHNILREKMRGVDPQDNPEVLNRLQSAYRTFEGIDELDPVPDVWVVTRAWIDQQMQP